jgi:Tfp pilus assembly protein PilF
LPGGFGVYASRKPGVGNGWRWVLLLALPCVGCSTPAPNEPDAALPAPKASAASATAGKVPRAKEPLPPGDVAQGRGQQELEQGVQRYEDGDHRNAARQFRAALDFGLATGSDQAIAHKYLAFLDCASGRERSCRDEFRKAFGADPNFDLTPAEAGHPIWGPVFRSVKVEAAKAKPK